MLKLKFKKLHTTIVDNVNPANIIDFLFQSAVVSHENVSALHKSKDDPEQQCRDLLDLLHASENPQSFVQLYAAVKAESHLQWLIERIDTLTDQSLIDVLQHQQRHEQQLDIDEPAGECVLSVALL